MTLSSLPDRPLQIARLIDAQADSADVEQSPSSSTPVVNGQQPTFQNSQQGATSTSRKYIKVAICVVVLVLVICLIGWRVHHNRAHKTQTTAVTAPKQTSAADSSNASIQSLQGELSNANSANSKSSQTMNNVNSSLNDQSTLTKVP
ncbi:MAG TPA: hypothetical protein VK712_00290 [Verrucomicrobiae bacterium]|jgi:hypothetical protein|nr:hypothetical protein [Verrucomicrobiae bacterium]